MKFIVIALMTIALLFLSGFITAACWNYALVPQGVKELTTLQGLVLNIMVSTMTGASRVKVSKS